MNQFLNIFRLFQVNIISDYYIKKHELSINRHTDLNLIIIFSYNFNKLVLITKKLLS